MCPSDYAGGNMHLNTSGRLIYSNLVINFTRNICHLNCSPSAEIGKSLREKLLQVKTALIIVVYFNMIYPLTAPTIS